MARYHKALFLLMLLIGCSDNSQTPPSRFNDINAANRILASAGVPLIPADANPQIYAWSLMSAGVFAKFEYSPDFIDKLGHDLVTFEQSSELPQAIATSGIPDTPWFTPGDITKGRYLLRMSTGTQPTREQLCLVVDNERTVTYLAYSWN